MHGRVFLVGVALGCLSGCRMGADVHVWQPAKLESAVGKRVAIANIEGPEAITGPVREKMLTLAPSDAGRRIIAVDPNVQPVDPSSGSAIRLVSGTDDGSSDLVTAAVARREGFDYVLRGQVINRNHHGDNVIDPEAPLAISWRLMSVGDDRHAGGTPVVIDLPTARRQYPDLAMVGDPAQALTVAAVRETYRLVAPSVTQERVQLAIPYVLPASKEVRRGNALAMAGRWGQAEQVWQSVVDDHPMQVAALHNLAIAAAAGQDFSRAKTLARQAIRRNPAPLHQKTLVWIERQQRKYHAAFGLPDPPEGWFVTRQ